jgi:propionyl-CoA synthetase
LTWDEGKPVGTPNAGAFWRVISQYGVKCLFTPPTAFRAIKREDPKGELLKDYNLSTFESLFLAGERLDADTYYWATDLIKKPVIDHWWQTESGWPMLGYDIRILEASSGSKLQANEAGVIAVKAPMTPGTIMTLWNDDKRFVESYMSLYPVYYLTRDGGYTDYDGYFYVTGRIDDVINVAGHRLSTADMEEVVSGHPDVAECAVIGASDNLKGQVPVGLCVLKAGVTRPAKDIIKELVSQVRKDVGAVACFKQGVVVKRLPKTRPGKLLRGTMRKIADGEQFSMPSTIEDSVTLEEIEAAFAIIGYALKKQANQLTWCDSAYFMKAG